MCQTHAYVAVHKDSNRMSVKLSVLSAPLLRGLSAVAVACRLDHTRVAVQFSEIVPSHFVLIVRFLICTNLAFIMQYSL